MHDAETYKEAPTNRRAQSAGGVRASASTTQYP
jgi:hypothetical protein